MSYKIGVIGPINLDLIIRGNAPTNINKLLEWTDLSDVYCITAGAAGNVAQNLKKLGNEIHLISCVADDNFGTIVLSSLKKSGIQTDFITIEEGKEGGIAIYILLFRDNKRPATYKMPTHHGWPYEISESMRNYLLDTDLLHSSGYLHFSDLWNDNFLNLFREAKEKGIKTSMDPQFPLKPLDPPWIEVMKPLISYIDILMVDESEALNLTGLNEINEAQFRILKLVSGRGIIYFGNDDESIYAFRGSHEGYFKKIFHDILPENRITLGENQRSVSTINRIGIEFIRKNHGRVPKTAGSKLIPSSADSIILKEFPNTMEEASYICKRIIYLRDIKNIGLEKMAIILKGLGYETHIMENSLKQHGIQYYRRDSRSLLDNHYVNYLINFSRLCLIAGADNINGSPGCIKLSGPQYSAQYLFDRLALSEIINIDPFFYRNMKKD